MIKTIFRDRNTSFYRNFDWQHLNTKWKHIVSICMGRLNNSPIALPTSLKPCGPQHIYLICNICLVVPYINSANQAPGAQSGPTLGMESFHRLIMNKTLKPSSETMRSIAYILIM